MGQKFSTPTAIIVDSYVSEISNIEYEKSLGNSRFLKTIKATLDKERFVIMKIFVKHDSTQKLDSQLERIQKNVWALQGLPSVLPYSFIYQTDKAVYALRQFMSSCLYDRISTRPFLSHVEKKWIAYQLLRAVSSAHEREVCHGDIKTENVMITSWNWVYLTDFASFKPTYLPENDPADFSYFFDSSGRRSCYLAPERFVSSEIYGKNSALMNEGLTTEMDTFSLGCVFAELFLDGNALFDLSQLLSYKRGNYSTESILSKVNDLYVAKLITEMINIDPLKRTLISDYLARDNPTFPKFFLHFYEFMQSIVHCRDFLDGQRGSVGSLCDYRIKMVYDSFEFLLTNIITLNSHMEANYLDEEEFKELMETVNISGVSNLKYSREFNKGESTSLLLSLLTSSIREAVLPSSRLMVVDMLVMLGLFSTDAIRLDLITPYLLLLCSDEDARVRCQSVKSLSLMLFHVKQIFPLDADMFSEYLFPELLPLKSDSCEFVRVAFASCFGALAETSIKFVELSQRNQDTESTGVSSKENRVTFETKMSDLHNLLLEIVTEFLLDKSNRVKRALLEGMTSLCLFLGKQKVNDVLLSHTITYLNSEDWSLRRSVIASLVEVGTFLGTKSLEQYILPVLMQSLTDQEELVVERVLLTLFSLADLKFIREERLRNVLVQTLPLLNHPGLRVRKALLGLLLVGSKHLSLIGRQAFLEQASSVSSPESIRFVFHKCSFEALKFAFPSFLRSDFNVALELCSASKENRGLINDREGMRNMLQSVGLSFTENQADRLCQLLACVTGRKVRTSFKNNENSVLEKYTIPPKTVFVYPPVHSGALNSKRRMKSSNSSLSSSFLFDGNDKVIDKQKLTAINLISSGRTSPLASVSPATVRAVSSPSLGADYYTKVDTISSPLNEKAVDVGWRPNSGDFATSIVSMKTAEYFPPDLADLGARSPESSLKMKQGAKQSLNWKPNGILVSSLTEHKGAIRKLVMSPSEMYFASCSDDGSLKLWESSRLDRAITSSSKLTYKTDQAKPKCMVFCDGRESIAVGVSESVDIVKIDVQPNSSGVSKYGKPNLVRRCKLVNETPVCVDNYSNDTHTVLAVATNKGNIYGWDLRCSLPVWKLTNPAHHGGISSFHVDKSSKSWIVTGSHRGVMSLWDLRFQIPVKSVLLPTKSSIHKIEAYSKEPSLVDGFTNTEDTLKVLIASGRNEISSWNMSTMQCDEVFCARTLEEKIGKYVKSWTPQPVPDKRNSEWRSSSVTNTIRLPQFLSFAKGRGFLITCGTDRNLRYWDCNSIEKSFLINGPESLEDKHYSSYRVNNTIFHYERMYSQQEPRKSTSRKAIYQQDHAHTDSITDVIVAEYPIPFIISASRDGVINIIK